MEEVGQMRETHMGEFTAHGHFIGVFGEVWQEFPGFWCGCSERREEMRQLWGKRS